MVEKQIYQGILGIRKAYDRPGDYKRYISMGHRKADMRSVRYIVYIRPGGDVAVPT